MLDYDLNCCYFLKQNMSNSFKSSNNIIKCPLEDFLYADALHIPFENYPSVFQSGSWRIDIIMYSRIKKIYVQLALASIYVNLTYIGDVEIIK